MKRKILFLTDLTNGEDEDLIIVKYLKNFFDIKVSYFYGIEKIEDNFDLIIIRNTWPSENKRFMEYNKLKSDFLKRAKKKNLLVYNDLNACADRRGKDYLVELFDKGYPVIPSFNSTKELGNLLNFENFLIKPKKGFSSIGIKEIEKSQIKNVKLNDELIQPKLDFEYEISFYFIDKTFLYCLIFEPSKSPEWPNPKLNNPDKYELNFAKKFARWNKMKSGISRIDALKMKDGKLLLLEIEDDSPYFSLTEINENLRNKFLEKFRKSVERYISRNA